MKVAETFRTTISYHHALVAQLDSVSASDAEGCGFDPRRVHQSPLFRGLLHSAGEQPLVRPTPKAAHEPLAAKYPRRVHQSPLLRGLLHSAGVRTHGSPDAEGGARAACGEVSPPGAPKPPFTGAFAYRQGSSPWFARRRRRRTSRLRRSIPAGCTKTDRD